MRGRLSVLSLAGLSTLAGLSLAAATSATSPTSSEAERVNTATLVFERAVETPAAAIPAAVMMRASASAVIATVRDAPPIDFIAIAQSRRGLDYREMS